MDFVPMFITGLVTSVHCVAMCGTLVLTYAVKDSGADVPFTRKMLPHLAYQSAKILSYVTVGLLLGTIGAAFDLGGIRGWVTIFAGTFMVLLGLNMTGKFPWLRYLTLRPPKFLTKQLAANRKKAMAEAAEGGRVQITTPLVFGLLTGLMPCGPLQAAQIFAAGTGSPVKGAVAMLGFGLGTAPLMLGFGTVSSMLGDVFKKRMLAVSAVIVIILGLVMLNRGSMLLGLPVNYNTIKTAVVGGPAPVDTKYTTAADGVVEVPLTIQNTRFVPAQVSIPPDKPARLIVDRQEDNSCSAQLAIPQLGVLVNLKANDKTVVEVPAAKSGTYTLTCGMGMMSGIVIAGGGAGGRSPLTAWALALAVAGLTYLLVRRVGSKQVAPQPAPAKGKGGKRAPQPEVATGIFGFTPAEVMVILAGLAAAVLVGLYLGGAFTY